MRTVGSKGSGNWALMVKLAFSFTVSGLGILILIWDDIICRGLCLSKGVVIIRLLGEAAGAPQYLMSIPVLLLGGLRFSKSLPPFSSDLHSKCFTLWLI